MSLNLNNVYNKKYTTKQTQATTIQQTYKSEINPIHQNLTIQYPQQGFTQTQ